VRRLLIGLSAFLAVTGTILVVPVSAAPGPEVHPVATSTDPVPMGSAEEPARGADVQEGTTEPVAGVPESAPALTVSRTDVEFSMVGVTWAADPAVVDTVVAVRVQDADGAWGDWSEVEVEDMEPDAGDGAPGAERRGGTAPLWTGPSTGVEAELVTRSGAAPADVQLDLIDPGTSAADGALGDPAMGDVAHAAMTMPAVYTRAQWGADESIRTWGSQYAPTVKAATIHHTANSNNYTEAQVPGILRGIYRYHAVSLGWGDIGYNVIADRYGNLYEGRAGGLTTAVIGAHAGGFNTGTVGVSMLGDYSTAAVPQAQIEAVSRIVAWKFSLFGVNPRGTTSLVGGGSTSKYPFGSTVTLPTIFAHRDVGTTACPGNSGYARMPEIRERVVALMAGQAVEPTLAARYSGDTALQSQLGKAIGSEVVTAGVTSQRYERGYMYWTPTTGAHVVSGQIWGVYVDAGGPAVLGAPTTDELGTPDGVGRFNHFQRDTSIYWTPATQAQPVQGRIRELWQQTGWETGPLGYPSAPERSGGGGRYSTFESGTIFWTPEKGAVDVYGDLAERWDDLGGVGWGVPTSRTTKVAGGTSATFSGDRSIVWSKATGAHVVAGQIRNRWTAAGGPAGPLGFPTADETGGAGDIRFSTFSNGTIQWTPAGGPRLLQGSINTRWKALGGVASGLGAATTDELSTPDGVGRYNHFANDASIYWSPQSKAHGVQGQIRNLWIGLGWERSALGYPTSDERATADGAGRYNTFQTGAVFWKASVGPQAVYGTIFARYQELGGVTSRLGYPTSSEYAVAGGRANDFERGRLTWNARTGAVTVTYR
jgi:uncharacterized protein with LGFP repeats